MSEAYKHEVTILPLLSFLFQPFHIDKKKKKDKDWWYYWCLIKSFMGLQMQDSSV